ncbi:hypothetical protein AB205_0143580 [Aquarana catesbeiana]|nr:hypothetical protein AB205_0143580 [Aquarana catesbeiana]
MIMKSEQDEKSPLVNANGCDVRNSSERHLLLPADCKSEDNVITQDPPGGNSNTQNIHHRPSCPETSMDPSDQGESSHQSHTMIVNIHCGWWRRAVGECSVDGGGELLENVVCMMGGEMSENVVWMVGGEMLENVVEYLYQNNLH